MRGTGAQLPDIVGAVVLFNKPPLFCGTLRAGRAHLHRPEAGGR
jgi:hypothetical protein